MTMPVVTIKMRRNVAAVFYDKNPILAAAEPAYERDTGKFKIGDGVTAWRDLPYFVPSVAVEGLPSDATEAEQLIYQHVHAATPHPVYDDGPSLLLLYQNAKV